MEKLLKLSVNVKLINKIPPQNTLEFSHGFEPVETTLKDLAKHIINNGGAFSYQFAGGIRRTSNFLCSDFLAVDIDAGSTIDEALAKPIVQQYCSLLYTTPSHSPDRHRFRLVFVLPRTITVANELIAAARSLSRRLGGDLSATDGARIFYGSTNCHYEIFDREISHEFLEELIADGLVKPESDSIADASLIAASRSAQKLEREMELKTNKNVLKKLIDFTETTPVYCPFHDDDNPSAFVSINAKGSTFFHCKTCQLTRWMQGSVSPVYDFHSFEKTIRDLKENPIKSKTENPLELFFEVDTQWVAKNIHFQQQQYLQLDEIKDGLMFIKSPKGSGKTTFLSKALEKIIYSNQSQRLDIYEDNSDEAFEPIYTEKRVLLIGHRQALIRDLCNRLGLNCYLDVADKTKADISHSQKRYGVCLDSLMKVKDNKYDIVVIDEVEQVLSHFLSDTIGLERSNLFQIFEKLIKNAKSIVALDADLGWVSFATLTKLANAKDIDASDSPPVNIYINEWKPEQKELYLYGSKNQLINHIKLNIIGGKRIFVSSNSKTRISNLEMAIQELAKELEKPIKVMTITSENSKNKEIQKFITNIKDEILNYQVVLSSPSLGTGVDITFENGNSEIDCVYGIYENKINSHTEIDQQLSRVRNPKEVHVWISLARFNFETEFDVVKQDHLTNNLIALTHAGHLNEDVADSVARYSAFLTMAAMITSFQRASKNNLRQNFIEYKSNVGWNIVKVSADKAESLEGKTFYNIGLAIKTEEDIEAILNATPLEQEAFEELQEKWGDNDEEISREEIYSYYRTSVELFYRRPISRDLIVLDNKGNFRHKVTTFEAISNKVKISEWTKAKKKSSSDDKLVNLIHEKIFKDRRSANILLYELLSTSPIFSNGSFDENERICGDDLSRLAEFSLKVKPFLENHFGINTRIDLVKKPIQHLGKLLDLAGVSLRHDGSTSKSGKKVYMYRLSKDVFHKTHAIATRRKDKADEWEYLNKLHNFSQPITEEDLELKKKNRFVGLMV